MTTKATKSARLMPFSELNFSPRFAYGEEAMVVEVCGSEDGTELGTGFGRFTNAVIPWTVKYDEILLVLEGKVTVETKTGSIVAGANDCIWLPKGTELTYRAESALVFYAIHPANWLED